MSAPGSPATRRPATLRASPRADASFLRRLLVGFGIAFPVLFWFFTRQPLIYDNDSYYHLAIARLFAFEGPVDHLESLRFSLLGEGFGDKEVLFHLLLAPFARGSDFVLGGQLFHSLLLALVFATFGALAARFLGPWGLAAPFVLAFVSTEVAWRWVRLRPELLALLLFLVALDLVARRRFRWLALVGLLFALGYTAFHAYVGLCAILFLFFGWVRGRWDWPLLLYPALGAGLGLVVHPHFPHNLEVWVVQSFDFFLGRGFLDVGTEIRPNTTDVTLLVHLGWYLLLAVLWRASSAFAKSEANSSGSVQGLVARSADAFGVAAVVFGFLYLLMSRFSLYFFPFATVWLLAEIGRRGRAVGSRVALPGRGSLPLSAAVALCLLVSLPEAVRQHANYRQRNDPGPEDVRLRDREQLAAALPAGAHVAARWQQTPIYLLWAPQGRYLNALDPIFMARPFPEAHRAQAEIFSGREPDVPLRLVADLDSSFVAYSRTAPTGRLTERLEDDPRIVRRHWNQNALFEVLTGRNADLVLDWRVVPETAELPLPADATSLVVPSWPPYPRLESPAGRSVEGFVDLRRITTGNCAAVTRVETLDEDQQLELSSWGPATLWVDSRPALEVAGSEAILGGGATIWLAARGRAQRFTIRTCSRSDQPLGFYLRRLPPASERRPAR